MPEVRPPVFELESIREAIRIFNSDERTDEPSKNEEATAVIPYNSEFTKEQLEQLQTGTIRETERGYTGDTLRPVEDIQFLPDQEGNEYVSGFYLNMEDLWKMVYEHRRYSHAKGFSDTEMEILRIVESYDTDRVTTREIKSHKPISDLSPGTVHNALNNLVDKALLKKHERALYSYIGP